MRADIITIGDEILIGQIVDTNSAWIAARLGEIGVSIRRKYSIGDRREEIIDAVEESLAKSIEARNSGDTYFQKIRSLCLSQGFRIRIMSPGSRVTSFTIYAGKARL